jgi:hypothetical protein
MTQPLERKIKPPTTATPIENPTLQENRIPKLTNF